jgi:hypothetical protein
MALAFTPSDIRKLEKVLGTRAKSRGSNLRFEIAPADPHRKLALEIYPGITIGKRRGNLISVYTETAHLQLHFCSGFVTSEVLGEVTFVGEEGGKISGLIVEREGGCSLFSNVDRDLLSGDFTRLGPEVMLSGIALSLTDGILGGGATPRRAARRPRSTGGTPRPRRRTAR